MKLYLAAGFSRQHEMRELAYKLRQSGIIVTSTWHDHTESDTDTPHFARYAERDLNELDGSDGIALFNGPSTNGGRHVEFGFVLAWNWFHWPHHKYALHIIGALENVFQYMESMEIIQHTTVADFLESITKAQAQSV